VHIERILGMVLSQIFAIIETILVVAICGFKFFGFGYASADAAS
jgi:hypothetical protein